MAMSQKDKLKSPTILSFRVYGFLFSGLLGCLHIALGSNPKYQAGLNIFIPELSGPTLILISVVYFYRIVQSTCNRSKPSLKPTVPETNPSSSSSPSRLRSIWNFLKRAYAQSFGVDGLLGENGAWYEYLLILRLLIEIPGQTYQAYQLSQRVPDSIIPIMYAIVIAMESISTSVILNLKMTNQRKKRSWMLLCDILGDFCFGIVFPTALMLSPLLELNENQVLDLNWTTKALATVKHLLITDELDLLLTCVPTISMYLILDELSFLWSSNDDDDDTMTTICEEKNDQEKLQSVTPLSDPVKKSAKYFPESEPNTPSKKSFKWTVIGATIGTIWGVTVLAIAIAAKFSTSCSDLERDGICISPLQPWFASSTSKCSCLIVQVNCDQHQKLINMETLFDAQLENDIRFLTIRNCPMTTTPLALLQHDQVWYFIVQDCTALAEWAIPMTQYQNLIVFEMTDTAFTQLPATFEQLPPGMYGLKLEKMPLSQLPDSIVHGWTQVRELKLLQCNFTHFPEGITSLSNLNVLDLTDNSIPSIPPSIANLQQLRALLMAGNQIQELPTELVNLEYLRGLTLAMNNISSIDKLLQSLPRFSTLDELQEWKYDPIDKNRGNPDGFLTLSGNPVCDLVELKQAEACFEDCAPLCDRVKLNNQKCNQHCNTENCQYDNGFCTELVT